jgi:hypothetical protein
MIEPITRPGHGDGLPSLDKSQVLTRNVLVGKDLREQYRGSIQKSCPRWKGGDHVLFVVPFLVRLRISELVPSWAMTRGSGRRL